MEDREKIYTLEERVKELESFVEEFDEYEDEDDEIAELKEDLEFYREKAAKEHSMTLVEVVADLSKRVTTLYETEQKEKDYIYYIQGFPREDMIRTLQGAEDHLLSAREEVEGLINSNSL